MERERLSLSRGCRALLAPAAGGQRHLLRAGLDRQPRLPPDDVSPQAVPARTAPLVDAADGHPSLDQTGALAPARTHRADDLGVLPAAGPVLPPGKARQLPLDLGQPRADPGATRFRRLAPSPLRPGGAPPAALGLSGRPVPHPRPRAGCVRTRPDRKVGLSPA